MVEKTTPVVPHDENGRRLGRGARVRRIAPVVARAITVLVTLADGVYDISHPRRAIRRVDRAVIVGMIRPNPIRDYPTDFLQLTVGDVVQYGCAVM